MFPDNWFCTKPDKPFPCAFRLCAELFTIQISVLNEKTGIVSFHVNQVTDVRNFQISAPNPLILTDSLKLHNFSTPYELRWGQRLKSSKNSITFSFHFGKICKHLKLLRATKI